MSSSLDKKGYRIVFVWNCKKLGFQPNKQPIAFVPLAEGWARAVGPRKL